MRGNSTLFPSELYYNIHLHDYLDKNVKRENILELKRVAKAIHLNATQGNLVFLCFVLAFNQYLQQQHYSHYILTLKPFIISMLQKIGIKMKVIDKAPYMPACLQFLDGNYFTDLMSLPKVIMGHSHDFAIPLIKYQKYFQNGTISIKFPTKSIVYASKRTPQTATL